MNAATPADKIANWWPAGIEPTLAVPAKVTETRTIVAAAGPRTTHAKEATTVLRYCWEYLEHRRAHGLPTDPAVAFTAENVETYRDNTLTGTVGTKAARCSYLKRLHPNIGLGGTTRAATAPTDDADENRDSTVGQPAAPTAAPAATTTTVTEAVRLGFPVDDLRPQLLDDAAWLPVAELSRQVVAAAAPQRRVRAQGLVTNVGYLAAWANSQHRPLTASTVLDGATIEAFLTLVLDGGRAVRGVASMATSLHGVREANGIGCDVPRRQFAAPAAKAPYTPDEIDALYRDVARLHSTRRRVQARAALGLMLGAGAFPGDAGWVTVDAVVRVGDDVKVGLGTPGGWDEKWTLGDLAVLDTIERRWVTVHDDYCDDLLIAQAEADTNESPFLLGGVSGKRNQRSRDVLFGTALHASADVDPTRARAVWLVEAAASGQYPVISDLLDAAGAETLVRVEDVIDHIRERAAERNGQSVLFASLADLAGGASLSADESSAA